MPVLPIRICSPRKTNVPFGYLHEIYDAPMLKAFFNAFSEYALLSRKLGICVSRKRYDNYGDCDEKPDPQILAILRDQAHDPWSDLESMTFVYWNHRPLTHSKWIRLLREAGFTVFESNTLAGVKALVDSLKIGDQLAQGVV